MKRLILILMLISLFSGAALSEILTLGFKGGLNLSNMTGDDIEDNEMKVCFGGGAFLNIPVGGPFSIQPELLYVMKGYEFESTSDAGVRMSYIDLPILAKLTIPTLGPISPNFFAGPYVGFNMSADVYLEDVEEDISDSLKTTDFGLVVGAGVDYSLLVGELTFDARYTLGLTSIDNTADEEDVKNTGIMIMAGYGFSL